MKKIICFVLSIVFLMGGINVFADGLPEVQSERVVLMDQDTGTMLFSKNADEKCEIASVTKVMTTLILMDEIAAGRIKYDDLITTGENPVQMGGSQIYLQVGEQMTVSDMLKGLLLASGNDAAVAIAEHISGSVPEFAKRMNSKAKELGMTGTNFVNPNGLPDENHYSTAKDVAIMSRELMSKYPEIQKYTTIWMDYLRNGEFMLANTNRLIAHYHHEGRKITGLKTGYTDNALHCLVATAEDSKMKLVAVVLGAPSTDIRFFEAETLLNYGFDNFTYKETINKGDVIKNIPVIKGSKETINCIAKSECAVFDNKAINGEFTKEINVEPEIKAPFEAGTKVGTLVIKKGEVVLNQVDLVTEAKVKKRNYFHIIKLYFQKWMGVK